MTQTVDQPTASPVGLLLSDDLMFSSRITGTARDFGLAMKVARSTQVLQGLAQQQAPQCVIVDLANPGLKVVDLVTHLRETCTKMPQVIAYGSHVDTATLKSARDAGCDVVLPRSKFVEELPNKLVEWMNPKD